MAACTQGNKFSEMKLDVLCSCKELVRKNLSGEGFALACGLGGLCPLFDSVCFIAMVKKACGRSCSYHGGQEVETLAGRGKDKLLVGGCPARPNSRVGPIS